MDISLSHVASKDHGFHGFQITLTVKVIANNASVVILGLLL